MLTPSVAEELYGLPAGEFTKARDQRAAAARQAGDKALAGEIKKLRRPTASAWVANRLARQRPDRVVELLALGAAMRDAQARLDGEELRRMSQQGLRLVADLAGEARQLAGDAGQPVGDAVGREVEETLRAALADAAAGDALQAGCLTSPLQYSGFGMEAGAAQPRPLKAAVAIEKARADVAAVEAEVAEAERGAAELADRAEAARRHQADLEEQVRDLTRQLEEARAAAAEAARAAKDAARAATAAQRGCGGGRGATGSG